MHKVSGKHNCCRFGSVGRCWVAGEDEAGHRHTLAVAEKRRLREGRHRCPVDTNVFWFETVFRSELVTTSQVVLDLACVVQGPRVCTPV